MSKTTIKYQDILCVDCQKNGSLKLIGPGPDQTAILLPPSGWLVYPFIVESDKPALAFFCSERCAHESLKKSAAEEPS